MEGRAAPRRGGGRRTGRSGRGGRGTGRRNNHYYNNHNNNSQKTNKVCRHGARCHRPDCRFSHPAGRECPPPIGGPRSSLAAAAASLSSNHRREKEAPATQELSERKPSEQGAKDYRFCSRAECEERQALKQVSALEATPETAGLPQAQRVLDPSLAVAKYRRSAAGGGTGSTGLPVHRETLEELLEHLAGIAATGRASPDHAPVFAAKGGWQRPWTEFLVDRMRAWQAGATRLFGQQQHIREPCWHLRMARLVLWVRYWMPRPQPDRWLESTLATMLDTALEHYWTTKEILSSSAAAPLATDGGSTHDDDDEVLCYGAVSRIAAALGTELRSCPGDDTPLDPACSSPGLASVLLDCSKHLLGPAVAYPRLQVALQCTSALQRQEYHLLLRNGRGLPVLARCCLAPVLGLLRYRQCQQYNVAFAKKEAVRDLDRLLFLPPSCWDPERAHAFLGVPCPATEADNDPSCAFSVVFKEVPMPSCPPSLTANNPVAPHESEDHTTDILSYRDDAWVFGDDETHSTHPEDGGLRRPMCLPDERIRTILRHGTTNGS